jgi:hypothetical protein
MGKIKKLELTEDRRLNSRMASTMGRATVSRCVAVPFFSRDQVCPRQKQENKQR